MVLPRLVIAVLAMSALAACGGNTPAPPPEQNAEAPAAEAPAAPQPAAPRPAPAAEGTAASASAVAPMIGTWAADLANCQNGAITITETRFEGAENGCDITSIVDNGDGSFTATLSCTAEGAATTERISMVPLFAPTGEGIGLTYLDRGNEAVTVLRCVAPRG
jgi:hypothetical protein